MKEKREEKGGKYHKLGGWDWDWGIERYSGIWE